MGRFITFGTLVYVLAFAPVACAQTVSGGPIGGPETIGAGTAESSGVESIFTPSPPPMMELPRVISRDPPVPYYSQINPPDDIPPFSRLFELPAVKLGWFALLELDYVQPVVSNTVTSGDPNNGGIPVGNIPNAIQVPNAQLPWSVMPRIDVGYRVAQGLGEYHAIFRSLSSSGTGSEANFDSAGSGVVTSRLNLNVLDLDYAFTEFNPGRLPRLSPLLSIPGRWGLNLRPEDDPYPTFRLKWAFGARMANVFFESQGAGQQILHERLVNNFVGGGLHTAVELSKPFPWRPSLSVYGRIEASGLFGATTQSFAQTEVLSNGTIATGAVSTHDVDLGVPILDVSCGLSYTPPWRNRMLQLTSGYVYEQWWYLGDTGIGNSNLGLTIQGVFFRCQFAY